MQADQTPVKAPYGESFVQVVRVSPIDLQVGDRVLDHGALMQVEYIDNEPLPEGHAGVRVAACISRLIGDEAGEIPRGWFNSKEGMRSSGCGEWVDALPDGKYWNVQGNARATVLKVVG